MVSVRLTPSGKKAEKSLARALRQKETLEEQRTTAWPGSYTYEQRRDALDNRIDRIEGNFADTTSSYYTRVRGSRRARTHSRKVQRPKRTRTLK